MRVVLLLYQVEVKRGRFFYKTLEGLNFICKTPSGWLAFNASYS